MALCSVKQNPLRTIADSLANPSHKNKTEDLIVNGHTTNLPNNVPIAIIGEKGSGKTTLLNAIIKGINDNSKANDFKNIFYIYTTLSLDQEMPEFVTRIEISKAESFLQQFFAIKSIYNSYCKFFTKLKSSKILGDKSDDTVNEPDDVRLRKLLDITDNEIIKYNDGIVNSGANIKVIIDKLISTGQKVINKFSKDFFIEDIKVNGLRRQQRDAIVIDDIAIAGNILFKQRKDNNIYEYLTLSRHMRILIIFAGQQIDQLPKMLRREIMCWILARNTSLELLQGIINKNRCAQLLEQQRNLRKYQFVIYNIVNDYVGVL